MAISRRHKSILTVLAVYWPVLFIITHIPIPDIARRSGLSDKIMHAMAYFVLVFFWWFVISPYDRVNWRRYKAWLTLAIIAWYGAMDEWLQGYVGRGVDVGDFLADLSGAAICLVMLSVLSFWPAALMGTAIFIFCITNMSKIAVLYPHLYLNTAFHFFGYALFALIWIEHISRLKKADSLCLWRYPVMIAGPVGLLFIVKLSSPLFGREVVLTDFLTAITAILSAVAGQHLVRSVGKRLQSTQSTDRQDTVIS